MYMPSAPLPSGIVKGILKITTKAFAPVNVNVKKLHEEMTGLRK